jgi:alkylation response protein AidB-like acyl-CoA dehydrogenase
MNYDLSQEQQILKDAARGFLSKECPGTFVRQMAEDARGFTPGIWGKMAELGWMGLLIPDKYGGSEGNFLDLAVLLYEMGYSCLPGPFFSTVVLAGLALLEAGSEGQKKDILPAVAQGKKLITLAWTEMGGTYFPKAVETKAEPRGDHYILSGTKMFVPDAHVADLLICVARIGMAQAGRDGDLSLFLVDGKAPGLTIHPLQTIAGDKQYEVTLREVKVPKEDLLGSPNQGASILKRILLQAAVAKCAEMSGGAQKVLELVIAHAKERVQFGRPVGAFQAVQHHCANILTYVDTGRFMTYQAAWRIGQGLPYGKEASMGKAWVSDSYRRLVALGTQVMGGMGFMEEHDIQLYFKRAKAAELAFGDADFHRELVAEQIGL